MQKNLKKKITIFCGAIFLSAAMLTACNNGGDNKDQPKVDSPKKEEVKMAPADSNKMKANGPDTTKMDSLTKPNQKPTHTP